MNESVIQLMIWGSIDSKMFSTYAHLTWNDIDREINKLSGISNDELTATVNRIEWCNVHNAKTSVEIQY